MKIKFTDWIYWVLSFLPLVVVCIFFPAFPETIPAHFDSSWQADRWGSRSELFIMPIAIIGIAAFFWFFFKAINKSAEGKNAKSIDVLKLVVIAVFNVVTYLMLTVQYNVVHAKSGPDVYKIIAVLISIADVIIANYLPKCRQNGIIGIRTKWTLENEDVWYRTHRFGGRMIAVGGIICTAAALLLNGIACLYAILAGEVAMMIILVLYSYRQSKKAGVKNE